VSVSIEVYKLAMKELCVRCGKETKYDTGTPITLRRYFIEGAGQLCEDCWAKLWPVTTIDTVVPVTVYG
jgi:NMD protein affecting ribosome stability and mRNA decay